MAALDYAPVPIYASLIPVESGGSQINREDPKTSPDSSQPLPAARGSSHTRPGSLNLSNILISSAVNIPNTSPSSRGSSSALHSTRDSLALQLLTHNFRRFVSRVGFLFWMTDRVEEIVMWRKGWTYTVPWIFGYGLICYQPKLLLILPNAAILCAMAHTHQPSPKVHQPNGTRTTIADPSKSASPLMPAPPLPSEGSTAWLANIQALQNFMGLASDTYDAAYPTVPYLTWKTRSSSAIFLLISFSMVPLWFLPLRLVFLCAGLLLFTATHPSVHETCLGPQAQFYYRRYSPLLSDRVRQLVNDVSLPEKIIPHSNELRTVEVFQNERWAWPSSSVVSVAHGDTLLTGWKNGAANLKPTERLPWTRRKDGSGGVGSASGVLNLSLDLHWAYVESEDWEPDFYGWWTVKDAVPQTDSDGWLYTNDAWLDPQSSPLPEWQKSGHITRRRRWTRRIYYAGP